MQVDRRAGDVDVAQVRRQHWKSRVGILTLFIDACQTAGRPGVAQIVQPWFPSVGRRQAKLPGQHSKAAVDGTTGTTVFTFIDEEWRLRILRHSKPRTDIAVARQRHPRAVRQRNQSGLKVLRLANMEHTLFRGPRLPG